MSLWYLQAASVAFVTRDVSAGVEERFLTLIHVTRRSEGGADAAAMVTGARMLHSRL